MKVQHVADLHGEGDIVDTVLVVVVSETRSFTSRPGEFLRLRLRDRTGEIEAKLWEPSRAGGVDVTPGSPVRIRGRVSRWKDVFEIIADGLEGVDPGSIDPADFLPVCSRPSAELWEEFEGYLSLVDDPHLSALLSEFRADAALREAFGRAPAALAWHHGYLGGLLEHSVSVCRLSLSAAETVPEVDRSMLVTGALLHDLGKVDDYRFDTIIEHDLSGRLLGHIVTGYRRIVDLAARVDGFPAEKLIRLGHIIVAHHRKEEWGAPQRPKTVEAQIVHYADNMDAQVKGFQTVLQAARSQGSDWSSYHKLLETEIFAKE